MPNKKKVVYLLGAGASHAEIKYLDPGCRGILMDSVVDAIPGQLPEDNDDLKQIKNILVLENRNIDIEQLITLYEHDVDKKHHEASDKLRQIFRKELNSRILQVLCEQPNGDDCIFHSGLLASLFDMYNIKDFDEELCAIITTNYDDLAERALQNVYKGFNYKFELVNTAGEFSLGIGLPLLKLHGSFNWIGEYPIRLDKPNSSSYHGNDNDDIIWAPPGAIKNTNQYPFSLIWSQAREILNCDILRVVGCSLSRNDWLLISLIHDAQTLRRGSNLKIQLVDFPRQAYFVWKNYPYLDVKYTLFDDYFASYCNDFCSVEILDREFESYTEESIGKFNENVEKNMSNIFNIWLAAKGYELKNTRKLNLTTEKNIFKRFYEKEASK